MGDEADKSKGDKSDAFEALHKLQAAIEIIRNPLGTTDAPARTCKDLALAHPELEDGMYFIDPNQGSPKDSVQVICHMAKRETCVIPKPTTVSKGRHFDEPLTQTSWFGEEAEDGFQFTYKIDRVQLVFLQLLSANAYQNVTYHCKNSAAYYDAREQSYEKSIMLETSNDLELTAQGGKKRGYEVKHDACQYKANTWAQTVFEVRTEKTQRLPLVDIAIRDAGSEDQEFGLEIGPVCFS